MPKNKPNRDSVFTEHLPKGAWDSGLDYPTDLSPLIDVLFTHYVRVDGEVSVANTEMLPTGSTLEALQVIHVVFHAHCHLTGMDPLVTGSTETILTKKPDSICCSTSVPACSRDTAPPLPGGTHRGHS